MSNYAPQEDLQRDPLKKTLRNAIAASVLRLSTRLGAHPFTEATFPGLTIQQAQEAALNAWLDDMVRGLAGITAEGFTQAVEAAADGEIQFWNQFSPKWIRGIAENQACQHELLETEEQRSARFLLEQTAWGLYQSWRYSRMGQLAVEPCPDSREELRKLRDPPPEFTSAKLEEFKAIAQQQLAQATPSVAKLEAVSLATRAAARFNSEQRISVAALERKLRLIPVYGEGELSPESAAELSQARQNLETELAKLRNPSPEFKAQRIEQLKTTIQTEGLAAPSSSGLSSVSQIKLRPIA